MTTTLLLGGILALVIGAIVRATTTPTSTRATNLAIAATGLAAALAGVNLLLVVLAGGDILGAALATLAISVTVTVQLWAARHLTGDPRVRRFIVLSSLLAAALTLTAGADSVAVFTVGWISTSVLVLGLLTLGGPTPQTRVAVRRTAAVFLATDASLVAAATLVLANADTGAGFAAASSLTGASAATAGTFVAVAALARAGAVPLHGWLPATLAAPTPVSALLHAGVVNAGALLLVRFAPLQSQATALIVGIAGGLTVVIAGTAMLTRPDIKGRLVQSTAAQMGFMLLACALGAYALAVLHVIGHALYKSYRFLSAGSAVALARRAGATAPPTPPLLRAGSASVAALIVLGLAVAAGSLGHPGGVLLPFIAAAVCVAVWHSLRAPGAAGRMLGAGITAAGSGYVLIWAGVETSHPLTTAHPAPAWLAIAVFLGAVLAAAALSPLSPRRIREFGFAAASGWSQPPVPPPPPRTPLTASVPLELERSPR